MQGLNRKIILKKDIEINYLTQVFHAEIKKIFVNLKDL